MKRVLGTLLFVVALIVTLGFGFLLFADAENVDVPGTGIIPEFGAGLAIFLGLVVLLLILLLVVRRLDDRETEAEDAEAFFIPEADREEQVAATEATFEEAFADPNVPRMAPEVVVYDIWRLPVARRAWEDEGGRHAFYYPRSVEGGVYVNDYVDISPGAQLKLRTLLAGPRDIHIAEEETFILPAVQPEEEDLQAGTEELESPGDSFMRELEDRYRRTQDTGDFESYAPLNGGHETPVEEPELSEEPVEAPEVYYDYGGDVHDVIDVEGIGPVYAQKLQQAGIHSTARLCYEDADAVAAAIDVPAKTVRSWQAMAELMKVSGIGPQYAEALARAGIEGIAELKRRSAARISAQVNEYLSGLETNVLGQKITERRVEGWQEAAKSMRRVRQKVPAQ